MLKGNSKEICITSGLLAVLVGLGVACNSDRSKPAILVTVQPNQSTPAHIGELGVTLKNCSSEDLLFQTYDLPWKCNAGGIDFVIRREDGSVVGKTPMIADPIVGRPVFLKRGSEISNRMSLLVYYFDLPNELALHDLKVNWSYIPKPTNSISTQVLTGEFRLKKLTPSGGDHAP